MFFYLNATGNFRERRHCTPYIQRVHAEALVSGAKELEGRVGSGWAARVACGDTVAFKISPGYNAHRWVLVARVCRVRRHGTFRAMVEAEGPCGGAKFLPGRTNTAAVQEYLAMHTQFGGRRQPYCELEARHGAVALRLGQMRLGPRAAVLPLPEVGVLAS